MGERAPACWLSSLLTRSDVALCKALGVSLAALEKVAASPEAAAAVRTALEAAEARPVAVE